MSIVVKNMTVKQLAAEVLRVLVVEARKGCIDSSVEGMYADYQNGNGEDIGRDIISLINQCEYIAGAVPAYIPEREDD